MKIGPVDTEIALLRVKKEEITEGKIHSLVGKFAERAKQGYESCHWTIRYYSTVTSVICIKISVQCQLLLLSVNDDELGLVL